MTVRVRKFTYQHRSLEVRAAALPLGWSVRLFEGNRQISPLQYDVSYPTESDARAQQFSDDIVGDLMELMQNETEKGWLRIMPPTSN